MENDEEEYNPQNYVDLFKVPLSIDPDPVDAETMEMVDKLPEEVKRFLFPLTLAIFEALEDDLDDFKDVSDELMSAIKGVILSTTLNVAYKTLFDRSTPEDNLDDDEGDDDADD